MSEPLPAVYLARHGETAWSLSGQHTGVTDLPLTERGECNARHLGERLRGHPFARVFTSPLQRARRSCELAGFGPVAVVDPDLVEWNYGAYEGRKTADIRKERPDWQLFRDGCPGGESPEQVYERAERFLELVAGRARGRVIAFAHAHILRTIAAAWVRQPVELAERLSLDTASLSILSDGDRGRVLRLWNDTGDL